jgi:hypothetical protein
MLNLNVPFRGKAKNDIKKDKPYLNPFPNRHARRAYQRKSRNKKSFGLVVTKISPMKFVKTYVTHRMIDGQFRVMYNVR